MPPAQGKAGHRGKRLLVQVSALWIGCETWGNRGGGAAPHGLPTTGRRSRYLTVSAGFCSFLALVPFVISIGLAPRVEPARARSCNVVSVGR